MANGAKGLVADGAGVVDIAVDLTVESAADLAVVVADDLTVDMANT